MSSPHCPKIKLFPFSVEIVSSYPNTMEKGYAYICDKEAVEALGLTEEYKSSDGKVIPFHDVVYQDEDFNQIGSDFEKEFQNNITVFHSARIGNAECKLINQKVFVDFAVNWMNKNRT